MGLLNWPKVLSRTPNTAETDIADHTVTAAGESTHFWQTHGRSEQLTYYVRACIDQLPPASREEIEAALGLDWQDELRKEYGLDERFDDMLRANWQARTVAVRDAQTDSDRFVYGMIDLHLRKRIQERLTPLPERSAEAIRESYQRKLRSERSLRWQGVAVNPKLAVLESSHETTLRDPTAVRRRAAVLFWTACAYDPTLTSGADMLKTMTDARLDDTITPEERKLLLLTAPTQEQRLTMMWNFESCLVLLWALGKIKMGSPRSSCHQNKLFQAVRRLKESPLRVQPLRPVKEILDEWDCIYRRHWAVTQSMFDRLRSEFNDGKPSIITMGSRLMNALRDTLPSSDHTHAMVVKMRHKAFNWLVDADGPDWDDVSTST